MKSPDSCAINLLHISQVSSHFFVSVQWNTATTLRLEIEFWARFCIIPQRRGGTRDYVDLNLHPVHSAHTLDRRECEVLLFSLFKCSSHGTWYGSRHWSSCLCGFRIWNSHFTACWASVFQLWELELAADDNSSSAELSLKSQVLESRERGLRRRHYSLKRSTKSIALALLTLFIPALVCYELSTCWSLFFRLLSTMWNLLMSARIVLIFFRLSHIFLR